jgi:hypothetical protein
MKSIFKIDSPDKIKQTVKVSYDNGSVGIEPVYKDNYQNFYIKTDLGNIFLMEFDNGIWLESILKKEK